MHILKIDLPLHRFEAEWKALIALQREVGKAEDALRAKALSLPEVKEAARIAIQDNYRAAEPEAEIMRDQMRIRVSVRIDLTEEKAAEIAPPKPEQVKKLPPRVNLDVSTMNLLLNGKLLTQEQKARLILAQFGTAAGFIINGESEA